MFLYDNNLWKADLEKIIDSLPILSKLEGKTVLITGAYGLICSSVVELLLKYNDLHSNKIQILAAGRSQEKMVQRFGNLIKRDDFTFVLYDALKQDNKFNTKVDYIIHGAGNAYPKKIVEEPVETMVANFMGLRNLLEYAKDNEIKRMLYISSSEVYGKKEDNLPFTENEYGFIDLLNPRNSYAVGKCASETLCVSYSKEYELETVIVRPGHIYGPSASINDNRVSSTWAYSAAGGEDIIMKSDGSQIRSYCFGLDCASAILTVLLSGENMHAYNISNPNSVISIKEMAEILAQTAGVKLVMETADEKEKKGFNPMSNSSLNSDRLLALGWTPLFDAQTGFTHTVSILNDGLHM